jgi:hypothetical protein
MFMLILSQVKEIVLLHADYVELKIASYSNGASIICCIIWK